MLFRYENRFSQFPIAETDEIAARPVNRIEPPLDAWQFDVPLVRQFAASLLRQIRHQSEVVEPALIDRFVDLHRPERRIKPCGQFRPFIIEKEIHCDFEISSLAWDLAASRNLTASRANRSLP